MGELSVIEWTHSTWNPWRGCTKVSPGCAECYMFRDQRRYGRDPEVVVRAAPATFNAPLSSTWGRVRADMHEKHGAHYVFTCSWSDWFHEAADDWREEAWGIIRRTPGSTYQILTKRPERIPEHLPADWGEGYPNVWLGVSIENLAFVKRADLLRDVPAAVRFVSAEPLLGPLTVARRDPRDLSARYPPDFRTALNLFRIDWLIVGGESGGRLGRRLVDARNRPRLERANWVRDLRDVCVRGECGHRSTAFLFKQWGGPLPTSGGRLLDGRTWDEMPRGQLVVPA